MSPTMKPTRLLLLPLFVFFLVVLLIPVSEAQRARQGQRPSGPSRENPAPKSNKNKSKSAAAKVSSANRLRSPLQDPSDPKPISVQAQNFAVSPPLRDIASDGPSIEVDVRNEEDESAENRSVREVTAAAIARAQQMPAAETMKHDTAMQLVAPTLNIPTPSLTFEGLGRTENINAGFGNLSPPDTVGDVGPNHYVQQTNLLVRVWNKAGTPLTAPFR